MKKQELNELFEHRITSIKSEKQAKRKRIYEINKKYADAFIEIVINVLNNINDIYKEEEIQYFSSVIGEFNDSKSEKKSTAILDENNLKIVLYFSSNPYKVPTREKEYDESIINNLLHSYNIRIRTIEPSKDELHPHIVIEYTYQKEKEKIKHEYEDERAITNIEACYLHSLIKILEQLNLKDQIILGPPKEENSIHIFKSSNGSWTVCNGLADYGLSSPQFCDDIKRAIHEVLKRLRINKETFVSFERILKEELQLDQEPFINIYGYTLEEEKRLKHN